MSKVYRISISAARVPVLTFEELLKETQQFYYTFNENQHRLVSKRPHRRSKDDFAPTPAEAWRRYIVQQQIRVTALHKQMTYATRCLHAAEESQRALEGIAA